ncbi:Dak1-domain-containing protein [Parathielavia hyrcaniae]|uniref:Dak1-domain-containing protein n=1 Tax=Parathielavia hyrcaniae TaxID=113614 RepID=A0AAN6QBC1_9PEZI|nr:Dak1-domain-containing protein [Parathielavia hyrcaniae]
MLMLTAAWWLVLYRQLRTGERKVVVLSGGGSGHEPAHAGFVGEGMLDVAVAGNIFASPSAPQILAGIRALDTPFGVLLITKNYTGDKLNFGLAAEQAKAEGREVRIVFVEDDVSIKSNELVGRRGLAGTVFVHKIAGAAAAQGLSLDEVARIAQTTANSLSTVAVSLDRCSVPQREDQVGLNPDTVEYGMGIHNEPGAERGKLASQEETVWKLLSMLLPAQNEPASFQYPEVAVMVNNLGGLSVLELHIVADEVLRQLATKITKIRRVFVGTFVTALDGPGFSVTILALNAELEALLDAPTLVQAWPKAAPGYSQEEVEGQLVSVPANSGPVAEGRLVSNLPLPRQLLQNVISSVAERVLRDEPLITKYDTIAGDGDCGTTLLTGAIALKAYAENLTCETVDLTVAFRRMASVIQENMGGTSGAIYAILFNAVSTSLDSLAGGAGGLAYSKVLAEALRMGLAELCRYTSARVGFRTIMDALIPFVEAFHESPESLSEAVAAACIGAEKTTRMDAKLGRASYVTKEQLNSEKEGLPDPGALGVVSILEGSLYDIFCGLPGRVREMPDSPRNELRPVCGNCLRKGVACEWGVRLSFRDENIQTVPRSHPSMRQSTGPVRHSGIEVIDITNEVIRDYWSDANAADGLDPARGDSNTTTSDKNHPSDRGNMSGLRDVEISTENGTAIDSAAKTRQPALFTSPTFDRSSVRDFGDTPSMDTSGFTMGSCSGDAIANNDSPGSVNTPHSYDMVQLAAVQLLDLGAGLPTATTPMMDPRSPQRRVESQPMAPLPHVEGDMPGAGSISPEQLFVDDGIFLPGSTYLELHSVLRNHIFDTARSTYPSRWPTPSPPCEVDAVPEPIPQRTSDAQPAAAEQGEHASHSSDTTPRYIELTKQEEYVLWKNWVDEIATWLDKFDRECHFQRKLPALAEVHSHLRFSMLALSARQLERKHPERSSSASLALYQEAVHQLVPQLQTRSTDVAASCVVLCVLEMMSCSPQMWRRHLDGCACLIQSLGINGFSGGLEQALFWCFARMDVCGGLISCESTLIPCSGWTPRKSLADSAELFRRTPGCDMYANFAVFLCAQALELLACDDSEAEFTRRWNELFGHMEAWHIQRPPEMRSILSQPPATTDKDASASPFPTLLFSNPPAISGNQLYHTTAVLMLQKKPRRAVLPPKTRPILWHARRICAISICNTHHGYAQYLSSRFFKSEPFEIVYLLDYADAQWPPSTLKSAPVMNELPAPSRKTAGALKSSGAPSRSSSAPAIQIFSSSGAVASRSSVMAVRM